MAKWAIVQNIDYSFPNLLLQKAHLLNTHSPIKSLYKIYYNLHINLRLSACKKMIIIFCV